LCIFFSFSSGFAIWVILTLQNEFGSIPPFLFYGKFEEHWCCSLKFW
jgi:hypothetical protein